MTPQWEGDQPRAEGNEIRQAFRRWAASVVGAPSGLEAQITHVSQRDESIARLTTTVSRRDLYLQRIAAPAGARARGLLRDMRSVDPFGFSLDQLRVHTEHIERCSGCGGTARVACGICSGTGQQPCGSCMGSGQILRQYKKSSKLVRCTVCKASGRLHCQTCGASGNVICGPCYGNGQQFVWWAYQERSCTKTQCSPESSVLLAHPALRAERPLTPHDLLAFCVRASAENQGPLRSGGQLSSEDASTITRLAPQVDPQCERVTYQQFVRFAAVCRDVSYEMCGSRGTVVLSGTSLAGTSTPEAMLPIQRRMFLWLGSSFALLFLGSQYHSALSGPTTYFDATNDRIAGAAVVATLAAIVATGGLLKAWRPGLRWWPARRADRGAMALFALAVLLCPAIRFFGRPSVAEARSALSRNDSSGARLVAEALRATRPSPEVAALFDDIDLHQARSLMGDARLARLDAAAARNGPRANEAREQARRYRIEEVNRLLAALRPSDALDRLNVWRPALGSDAEAAELGARAHDQIRAACTEESCRWREIKAARVAHATPERDAAQAMIRAHLLQTLTSRERLNDPSARVRSLRALSSMSASLSAEPDDPDMVSAAREASVWADTERGQIVLIGAPRWVADDLLGRVSGGSSAWNDLQGVAVFVAESGARCAGLYVVGATAGARGLSGRLQGVQRLLAQATGSPLATLHEGRSATAAFQDTRWTEAGSAIVARWRGSELMELRIGSVSP